MGCFLRGGGPKGWTFFLISCQKGMELIFWFGWKVGWESVEVALLIPLGRKGTELQVLGEVDARVLGSIL